MRLKVINYTEVYIPSINHKDAPYTVCLLEDKTGKKYLRKLMQKVEVGQSLKYGILSKKPTIAIIGKGLMGNLLHELFTEKGYSTIFIDRNNLTDANKSEIVIEAITENFANKKVLLDKLSKLLPPTIVIATTTSSLSITKLAMSQKFPERFIGWHFFNPPDIIRLVEIIPHEKTNQSIVIRIKKLSLKLEKIPIIVADQPGFIVNRLLMLQINQAIDMLDKETATKEEIDKAVVYGLNHRMGPIALADFIGLDVCLAILESIYQSTKNIAYKPAESLNKIVSRGFLGRKTKRGYYKY